MTTSIACIREAETLVVARAGPLTATVYVEDGLPGVVQIDHRRGEADELAEADSDHPRYFKRLWPLALRVIEAAVGDMQPAEARV